MVPLFQKHLPPPKMNECRLRRDRFKRKRNIVQPSIFRGYSLVFRGTNPEDAFLVIKAFGSFMSRHDSISRWLLTMVQKRRAGNWLQKNTPALRMKKGNSSSKSLCFASSCQMFLGCIVGSAHKNRRDLNHGYIAILKGVLKELQAPKNRLNLNLAQRQTTNPPCLFVHSHPQSANCPQKKLIHSFNGCFWFP